MKHIRFIYIILLCIAAPSCKKYLDAKPDSKMVVPETLADYQTLLDNSYNMNKQVAWSGEGSSDDYYIIPDYWGFLQPYQQNVYIWGENSVPDALQNDWSLTYMPVYYSNIALEGTEKIKEDASNTAEWNNLKGSALFFRSKYFFDAVLLWAKAYDENTAAADPGIPLRLNSDINGPSTRASIQECFDRIITDLKESSSLLPATPAHVMRPSRPAAYALLARVYLYMQRYDSAGVYAGKCLEIKNSLLDYNTLNASVSYPIPQFNDEVIMHFTIPGNIWWLNYTVDSTLYNSYSENDLRKSIFFTNPGWAGTGQSFSGSYDGSGLLYFGLTTDEVYLTRAESYVRQGELTPALNDLNTLLKKRWKAGTFSPVVTTDKTKLLDTILVERRKELLLRGVRWMDLKRLNKEGTGITLKRIVNGETYMLPPNDNRYALPIPDNIISTTGMEQNPR
jgi:starch-binding outer membrane protein, SusD/RagB family